ncbi:MULTISPECIES: type VI secretion system tip protein TssI/VgrG [unclassified Burkholderia]|uniref:type VI secretion system Vgr family protein n=1 Tax=unclassified Burkholderia TaxID=2613784 RepID=UPI001420B9D6|nr:MULTISPECIES: type VI secretion system tip protein TssI/VgrG [unclassified Burkholderia]NIE84606.1 type VI secretion system tip protein VgrG [Burkholderia sp. Tr-860]NIF63165.1 type VI secretion system tip protein VgrG [Burkholderia sp. Cy-647]NIF98031.1 type VI secretion system tip protein VgrG [Burkholderia sp. Ax-1720]
MVQSPERRRADETEWALIESMQRGWLQHDRLLKLHTPLGASTLVPIRLLGSSRIGRDYRFTIDVVSTRADIALLSLMHQAVTLSIRQRNAFDNRAEYSNIHGFVHHVGFLGMDGGLAIYQIEFSSALHFLRYRRDDALWLERDAVDIVSEVLDRYPQLRGRFRFRLAGEPRIRSYCRQGETDWNFVCRLLEDEGWYYYWEHRGSETQADTTLVIVDRIGALPGAKPANYLHDNFGEEADGFSQWSAMQSIQSLGYLSRSFDYKEPNYACETSRALNATSYPERQRRHTSFHEIPAAPLDVFEQTSYGYRGVDAGNRRATVRAEAWDSEARRYRGVAGIRWLDAGSRFSLEGHPRHVESDPRQREFVVVEIRWTIENNVPIGSQAFALPHGLDAALADARALHGTRHQDGATAVGTGKGVFLVEIEAQETRLEFRSPLEHPKPTVPNEHALVVAPKDEEAWADEWNRVRVRFPWDRRHDENQYATSPPLLSVQADTGGNYGAVHVPRAGEWVVVGHWQGDCDRPFILGRLPGGLTRPPWHTDVLQSGFKSRGFGDTGAYNAFVHDDATNQGATRATTLTGQRYSLFHQGYLIEQDGNARGRYLGAGFMLHADDFGVVRARRGLYLHSHPVAHDDEQLALGDLREQLDRTGLLVESLSSASASARAETLTAGQDSMQAVAKAVLHSMPGETSGGRTAGGGGGSANGFSTPLLMMASPAGIGLSTQQSGQFSVDRQLSLVSGESTHIATGKSLIAVAAEKLSLFVQTAGMKLFAAKGKVEIQAQSDDVLMYGDRSVSIKGNRGSVVIEAKTEIMLKCGGSYIRITADGIEDGSRGPRAIKAASFSRQGPSSVPEHMNELPKTAFNDPHVLRHRITGEVLKNHSYEVVRSDGTTLRGATNEHGYTLVQKSHDAESLTIRTLVARDGGSDEPD